jgi:VanZ family protein
MVAGALVSLSIECVQVWLPMRDSSLVDFATNTLGALLGGMVPRWIRAAAPQKETVPDA